MPPCCLFVLSTGGFRFILKTTMPTTMQIEFTDEELKALRAHLEDCPTHPEHIQSAYDKLTKAMAPDPQGRDVFGKDAFR